VLATDLAFDREGTGPPLVLLHGVGHHRQTWRPVTSELRWDHDVIAVDSPGFGGSPPLPVGAPHTVDAYTDALEAWFGEMGLDGPHVAGNSMGGAIALELARRGAVASATAFSPIGFWSPGERRWCQRSLEPLAAIPPGIQPAVARFAQTRTGRLALFSQLLGRPLRTPPEEVVATLEDAWASADTTTACLEGFDNYDFHDGHQLDATPVTVAWGSRDRLLLYRPQSRRAREALPRARHITLKGLGHLPSYDDPGLVAGAIRTATAAPS
jgi:pimeloyl-ACP methyl ester carboxylesterase